MAERKVTMKQIAERLTISINAVSLALNNREGVSDETRKQVLRIANEMGYLEQSDKYNKAFSSKNICVMMRKIYFQDMHFYSRVIYGMEREAEKQGYDVIIQFTDESLDAPACVQNRKVAGIILVGPVEKDRIEMLRTYGIPMIFVDSATYTTPADSILTDNRSGMFTAVNLLIESKYRRIGFFGDLDYSLSIKERYCGYLEAMAEVMVDKTMQSAVEKSLKWSVLKDIESSVLGHDMEGIVEKIKTIKEMPEAFVCSNDRAAIILMNALRALGYRVPEDIGIIGFDDVDLSTMVMPGLTTLHVGKKNMGIKAVQVLQWRLQNRKAKPEKILLPVDLVIRGSVILQADR